MLLRRHQRLSIVLLGFLLGGCGKSGREVQEVPGQERSAVVEPEAVGEEEPAPVCDEEHREAVLKELRDMCAWSAHLAVVDVPMSPWGGSPYNSSSVDVQIAVGRDQIRMLPTGSGNWVIGKGNPLGEQTPIAISEFAVALSAIPSPRKDADRTLAWSLQIENDVPSAVVAEVFRTLSSAKMLDGQIVLQNPDGPAAVRDPMLHAKLDASRAKLAPEQRIGWAKQELERFAGPCLSFDDAIEAANSVYPDQVCVALATGLSVAMNDCECAREAEILTVMYAVVFGAEPPKNRVAPVRARISPDATPRRGKTWGSIVAGFKEKEDALSLWVSGEE